MKLTTSLMIVTLASGSLWAQAPAKTPAPVPAKTSATTPAKPAATAAKPAATPAKPAMAAPAAKSVPPMAKPVPVAAKAAAPMAKPVPAAKKPEMPAKKPEMAAKKPVTKPAVKAEPPMEVAKPASAKEQEATRVSATAGKRDPFVSPIVRATSGGQGPVCETGKRCLMVDQIMLKGIVKSPSGYIAVVENPLKRAYFLRENDPVFNGSVVKITGDSVTFREATTDKLGKQTMREVVKKVNAPVV
jgi:Tfp pilus assembly protein PilP